MGRMGRQDQGGFSSTAHPTNQKGHRLSSTCVKSRAQVITGEQQMLHLRDGSRTVPDKQEFASEPQRKALPTAAVGSGGSKRCFHNPAPGPPSTHIFHRPSSSLQDAHARHKRVPPETSASLKKRCSYFKSNQAGIGGSRQPNLPSRPQSGGRNLTGGKQQQQKPSPSVEF